MRRSTLGNLGHIASSRFYLVLTNIDSEVRSITFNGFLIANTNTDSSGASIGERDQV